MDEENRRQYTYIVFVDDNLNIDWITADNSLDEYSEQIYKATVLESMPNKHLPREQIIAFKSLIGEAIVAFLEGHPAEASQLIVEAQQYINSRIIECSRKWTLEIALALILPLIAVGLIMVYSNVDFIKSQGNFWILSCFWGIIGTFLSIVQRVGKETLDSAAGRWLHFLKVSTQLLTGGLLGIVAYFILNSSGICPPLFRTFSESNIGFCLFGFIAGFFEQFVPNIITSLQTKEQTNG